MPGTSIFPEPEWILDLIKKLHSVFPDDKVTGNVIIQVSTDRVKIMYLQYYDGVKK